MHWLMNGIRGYLALYMRARTYCGLRKTQRPSSIVTDSMDMRPVLFRPHFFAALAVL
jgi:hypothetical protein